MKIMWLVNITLPRIDLLEGNPNITVSGGWLTGLSNSILENELHQLTVLYPSFDQKEHRGRDGHFSYRSIPVFQPRFEKGTLAVEKYADIFSQVLREENPDVIHIHGSEYTLSYALALAGEKAGMPGRIIVSIQGLVGVYAKHFYAGLPESVCRKKTLYERVKRVSLTDQCGRYLSRGRYEENLLRKVPHVIGRTRWDRACAESIAPETRYFFCNETLRDEFYEGSWAYSSCEPHSIFISQGTKPIKGLHMLIEAAGQMKARGEKIKIYIAGQNIFGSKNLQRNTYARYLKKCIHQNGLNEDVCFLGLLNARQMKAQMLKANAFVCPSSIENSPNSLGEAMLLGVPCIASDVGGVLDMLEHGEEGFVYPFNETYMLQHYIKTIFDHPGLAAQMGERAKTRAMKTHDAKVNFHALMDIYEFLSQK